MINEEREIRKKHEQKNEQSLVNEGNTKNEERLNKGIKDEATRNKRGSAEKERRTKQNMINKGREDESTHGKQNGAKNVEKHA